MQTNFNFKYNAPSSEIKMLSNFKGVDYTKAELDIAENRAYQMENFIFKDGINQKRNGYKEIFQLPEAKPINGYWEFVDSSKRIHRIVHSGTKFYRITLGKEDLNKDYYSNSYEELGLFYRPYYFDETEWMSYLAGIKDRKSFGVIRGDRLYIFCGIMLVYGSWDNNKTWELRAVRDNIDTYIPVTTTNITHLLYTGNSSRASLEEVNMMHTYRINQLYGDKSEIAIESIENYSEANPGIAFSDSYVKGYLITADINDVLLEESNKMNITLYIPPQDSSSNEWYEGINFNVNFDGIFHNQTTTYENDFIKISKVRYKYEKSTSKLLVYLTVGYVSDAIKERAVVTAFINSYNIYQLDSTNIERTTYPPVLTIRTPNPQNNIYIIEWDDDGYARDSDGITLENIQLDFSKGILKLSGDFSYKDYFKPNIELKFTTVDYANKMAYEQIDNCSTGIMFGYNGVEHLFVSGNDNYPNMDWHTSESLLANDNYNLPNSQNLTYFSDLSYAYLGSPQTKVKSYLLLNDNTLGILKEYSSTESSLFIREPYITDALDPSGNIVYDATGKPYSKIYYKQYFSAIGEGCISSYANANIAGDKVFLSKNGLYGIELDLSNLATNQRYAKERSRRINPVLETYDKEVLKNATSIVYENRYYLAINDKEGTVYVADARFRNGGAEEMNDTLGYEWWVWKNVKANVWYIDLNGNLCFGDDEGRLYSFNDKNNFKDIKNITLNSGAISYSAEKEAFVFNENYIDLIKNCNKIHFETVLEEVVLQKGDIASNSLKEGDNLRGKTIYFNTDFPFLVDDDQFRSIDFANGCSIEAPDPNVLVFITEEGQLIQMFYDTSDWKVSSYTLPDDQDYIITQIQEAIGSEGFISQYIYYAPPEYFNLELENTDDFYSKVLYFVDKKLKLYNNETFIMDCYIDSKSLNYEEKTFSLRNYDTNEIVTEITYNSIITAELDDELILDVDDNDYSFKLFNHYGNNHIKLFTNKISNLEDLRCDLIFEKNVKAIWYTPYMNMGTSEYQKTLKYLTLTPQNVLHGNARLSILTKGKNKDIIIEGIDVISVLNNLSLNSFSLEIEDFAKSFTKKVKIRNFNFIMLNITSDNDKNFAIHNIELNYIVSKRNKGVS